MPFRISNILILKTILFMTFKIATANGQDKSKINKYSYWEKWTTSFRGQVTISTGTSNDIPLGRSYYETGIEYIPRISVKKSLKKDRFFDAEWEYKFNKLYTGDSLYNSIEKNHRLWIRYASNKIEARFGLQKMVFGPTQILRPLSWFDTFDLKDPTSQTDGVKAFRLRWYPSNSFSTSSWVLMNEQDTLTIGCRLELSNNLGEWGLTIHQDKSSSLQFLGQLGLPIYGPHSRAAIDYRYDGLFGFWNESAFISSNKSKIRLMTIGADYTLPISNGILIMTETMHLSNQFEDKKSDQIHTAFMANLPIGINHMVTYIAQLDWNQEKSYYYVRWNSTFDSYNLNMILSLNPKRNQFDIPISELPDSIIGFGTGIQMMLIYNY
ncbi:MAG: hypothetical protein CMG60_05025 [Candidatus Marinimicrobia bacterium]|nr:hypothetical protein [Candidatus Neomarinimicrobiota bacterium]